MSIIQDELNKPGIACNNISILRNKDGITVARIVSGEKSYIVKHFQKDEYKREIENYRLLACLGIPSIQVIASTDSLLLLEDIDRSPLFRLGIKEDMSDPEIARRIAVWYKQLHSQGYNYVCQYRGSMYDEADFFTLENIAYIKEKTGTQDSPAWVLLDHSFHTIFNMLCNAKRTLTYNDFYYTNMVVAKDKSSALMFDYNLLGKGYAYSDLRNVMSSLSAQAKKAFLEEYGEFDPTEKALDDVVSVVITLFLACQRDKFPLWAKELLAELETTFIDKIEFLKSSI